MVRDTYFLEIHSSNRLEIYTYLCKAFESILGTIRIECGDYALEPTLCVYKYMYNK